MRLVALSCVFATHLVMVLSQAIPDRSINERYPFVTDLDTLDKNYILKWGYNDTHIVFEVQARTLGYVGFGISESGRMYPADVVVGWISADNMVHFYDYHTTQYGHPELDARQSWTIVYGYEENGWTVLGFRRPLDTCDPIGDRKITRDTLHLIWSYDAVDPADSRSLVHHDRKGHKSVALLTASRPPSSLPTDASTLDFLNANYTIPSSEPWTYHCRVFDLSSVTQKLHVIKAEPILSTDTQYNVGQMILYRCRVDDPDTIMATGQSFNCFTDAPNHVQFCREHVASFGRGGEAVYFPDDVGIPLGGTGEANVYVLATHFTNEDYVPGLVDDSGIRLTYTAQLRPNDAAYLSMGNIISQNWLQFIPPGFTGFRQNAYCSERCLNWAFRGSGSSVPMTVVGVQFHSHDLATQMKLRHMTRVTGDTYRENPFLSRDFNYDPYQQSFRLLQPRQNVSYFDHLKLECTYDSVYRDRPTVGGWSDHDELCRAYVLYYPRKPIEGCMSWSNYDQFRNSDGLPVNGQDLFSTLIQTNWTNNNVMRQNLRTALDTSIENSQCWSSKQKPSYAIDWFNQSTMNIPEPYVESKTSSC